MPARVTSGRPPVLQLQCRPLEGITSGAALTGRLETADMCIEAFA